MDVTNVISTFVIMACKNNHKK